MSLKGQRIILGISGGIAAYKSAFLTRLLIRAGAQVRVIMTKGAQAFIQPLTLQALSHHPVASELFNKNPTTAMSHIELARWADLIIIAPTSANTLARLAHGMADDLLTTVCLASTAQRFFAPAMNQQMWANPAVRSNVALLKQQGWQQLGPMQGEQACGEEGVGRMIEADEIVSALISSINQPCLDLDNLHIVITAGPTREALDPVRYLSNRSSGKMGYALAEAASAAGAVVTLISGPVNLAISSNIHLIQVESAEQMLDACHKACQQADIFIAAAAVADFYAPNIASEKIKKTSQPLTLTLSKTVDILASIANEFKTLFCVGFAAETQQLEQSALTKLKQKNLAMIIANQVSNTQGFDAPENMVDVYWFNQQNQLKKQHFPLQPKITLAQELLLLINQVYLTHLPH